MPRRQALSGRKSKPGVHMGRVRRASRMSGCLLASLVEMVGRMCEQQLWAECAGELTVTLRAGYKKKMARAQARESEDRQVSLGLEHVDGARENHDGGRPWVAASCEGSGL
jgi:hypothetical protein